MKNYGSTTVNLKLDSKSTLKVWCRMEIQHFVKRQRDLVNTMTPLYRLNTRMGFEDLLKEVLPPISVIVRSITHPPTGSVPLSLRPFEFPWSELPFDLRSKIKGKREREGDLGTASVVSTYRNL